MMGVVHGAVAMGFLVAAMFWVRYFRATRDALFVFFAIAFLVEAANRAAFGAFASPTEGAPIFYVGRLVTHLLILAAIAWKNLSRRVRP